MNLRPYQQAASDAAFAHIRRSRAPILIEAPAGSGNSHIIVDLVARVHEHSKGKRVLVLAPWGKRVTRHVDRYRAAGSPASIFSASAGEKDLSGPAVFGTPQTVKNSIDKFGDYAAVIIDEADGITTTLRGIVNHLRDRNQNLRVIGLTETPYRLGGGYIYAVDDKGMKMDAKRPYFARLVYRISEAAIVADVAAGHPWNAIRVRCRCSLCQRKQRPNES